MQNSEQRSERKAKPSGQVVGRSLDPVIGLRWVDTFDGAEYEISGVTEDNISYSHTPGQGWISGGAHGVKAWKERVQRGQYIVHPNHTGLGTTHQTEGENHGR